MNLDDLRKASGTEWLFALLFVSAVACPGMLTIWHFAPTLVEKCGAAVFLLLSIAVTLPALSINTLAFAVSGTIHAKDESLSSVAVFGIAVASCATIFASGVPLLVAFLCDLSLKSFVTCAIVANLVACAVCAAFGMGVKSDGAATSGTLEGAGTDASLEK